MTKKQKEAIKMLEKFITEHKFFNIKHTNGLEDNIETVLSMLKEKDKEIEKLEKQSKNLDKQAQQYFEQTIYLDKQIDLMEDYMLSGLEDIAFNNICKQGHCIHVLKDNRLTKCRKCKECIKQYFEGKVKE